MTPNKQASTRTDLSALDLAKLPAEAGVVFNIPAEDQKAIHALQKLGYEPQEPLQHYFNLAVDRLPPENADAVYRVVLDIVPLISERLERHNASIFSKLVEVLVDNTPATPAVLLQSKMQARAINRIMQSGEWMTAQQVAEVAGRSTTNPSAHTSKWKKQGLIFSIEHKNKEYYPSYALDPDHDYRPYPELKRVLEVFQNMLSGWNLAFWFDSPNSYLGGKRPKSLLVKATDQVCYAAEREVCEDSHG